MQDTLLQLKETLERAAVLADEVSRKQEAVTSEEEAVLTQILEMVKPILPAICEKVEIAASHSGHQFHEWSYEYLDKPGLVLVGEFGREYTDRDYRGEYTGTSLVLTADGGLVELSYYGSWSNWQGEPCHWNSVKRAFTPRRAVEAYDFADIVTGLARAIKEAAKKQEKKQDHLEERLRVLEQVRGVLK